jgi:RNA polymerase sigma-70 factor (ECF subfamily)
MHIMELTTEDIARLYERYYKILRAKITHIIGDSRDAEDLTQEVFIRILKHKTFTNVSDAALNVWINTIATNIALDYLRTQKSHNQRVPIYSYDTLYSPDCEENQESYWLADSTHDPQEQDDTTSRVLRSLQAHYRQTLLLTIQGYNYHEIARICQISEGSAKMWLHRAKKAFQKQYQKAS